MVLPVIANTNIFRMPRYESVLAYMLLCVYEILALASKIVKNNDIFTISCILTHPFRNEVSIIYQS